MRKKKITGITVLARCKCYLAVMAALGMMVSCSDSDGVIGGSDATNVSVETLNIVTSDNSRVTNYKDSMSVILSRAAMTRADSYEDMPDVPTVPDGAVEINSNAPSLSEGQSYVIKSGTTLDQLSFEAKQNATIYIEDGAEVTFTNMWGSVTGFTIYVLPDATVTDVKCVVDGGLYTTVYNYSKNFTISTSSYYINNGAKFYTSEDLDLGDNSIQCQGFLYVGGDLTAPGLVTGNNANVVIVGNTELSGNLQLSHGSYVEFEGSVKAPSLDFNGQATVVMGCSCEFTTKAVINNASKVYLEGLLTSPYVELNSQAQLYLSDGAKVKTDEFYMANPSNEYWSGGTQIYVENGFAVIDATKFSSDIYDLQKAIRPNGLLGLVYDTCGYHGSSSFNGNNGDVLTTISNVLQNEDGYTNVPKTDCVPTGDDSSTTVPDNPYIDHIADVETLDHEHDISATCVYMVDNNAYVSYHTQGSDTHGCVEALSFDKTEGAESVTLNNYLESDDQRDFNHLIADNGMVLATGNDYKKGGIIVAVPVVNGAFSESGSVDNLEVIRLKGTTADGKYASDGNCIVRKGSKYLVASTEGFETMSASDFTSEDMIFTDAQGKFICVDKNNGSIVTLNLTNKTSSTTDVEINTYASSDVTLSSPTSSTITVTGVTPVDGKNVCKNDGNYIYACLGDNGLMVFTKGNSTPVLSWKPTSASRVNGMDYDDDYLYLACGSAGVYVLDKASAIQGEAKVVAKYTNLGMSVAADGDSGSTGLKSANYIEVDSDRYIFVAFGRDGFRVFRLVQP